MTSTHRPLSRAPARRLAIAPRRLLEPGGHKAIDAPEATGIKARGAFAYVVRRDQDGRLRLAPAWPLWALLVGFPVWWALGVSAFIFVLLAIPMAITLVRRRPVRRPRAFWLWGLYLVWVVLSLAMYLRNPSGTHPGSLGGRSLSTVFALANHGAATVILLFVGNLSDDELPVRRLMRWLSALFLVTVAGGVLGTVAPHFGFTSPFELLVPHSVRSIPYVHALVHPAAAQVQALLGDGQNGRAAAPFGYTNSWANNLSLLLVWFVCYWGVQGSTRRRVVCAAVVAISVFPIVYSLNRGLWIGIAVTVLWVAIRLFLHGRVGTLFAVLAATAIAVVVFLASPLHAIYSARLANPNSNSIRSYVTAQAIDGAVQSPIIGWGGTRKTNGSYQSIAVGKSPQCPLCGEFSIGGNGQLWGVLFNTGFVGTIFYFGFFGVCIWLYRRDRSPPAQAGVLVVALTFVYMFVYNAVPAALTMTMISIGILWRSHDARLARLRSSEPLAPATR